MDKRIEEVKSGNRETIGQIYKEYRTGFILFLSRYSLSKEEIADIYQDAIIAFVENVQKGKCDDLSVELKTYLFSIGKYMTFKRMRNQREIDPHELESHWYQEEKEEIPNLEPALSRLGKRCYEILKLFYYEGKKLEQIQEIMGYDKKDVLKSQKSRCLKQLKDYYGKD